MQMGMRMGRACSTVSDKNRKPKYIRVSLSVCVCECNKNAKQKRSNMFLASCGRGMAEDLQQRRWHWSELRQLNHFQLSFAWQL